jgi:hypothetical protein
MGGKRKDRVRASQKALGEMDPRAAARAIGKAKATGRTYPTSGQRGRAKKRTKRGD